MWQQVPVKHNIQKWWIRAQTNNEAKPHEIKNKDSHAKAETSYTTDDQNPFSGSSRRGQISKMPNFLLDLACLSHILFTFCFMLSNMNFELLGYEALINALSLTGKN